MYIGENHTADETGAALACTVADIIIITGAVLLAYQRLALLDVVEGRVYTADL